MTTVEGTPVSITLAGSDPEGDALSFEVVTQPANGTLSGTAPALTYTPAPNSVGADSFTFTVNDGTTDSAAATVSLTVTQGGSGGGGGSASGGGEGTGGGFAGGSAGGGGSGGAPSGCGCSGTSALSLWALASLLARRRRS